MWRNSPSSPSALTPLTLPPSPSLGLVIFTASLTDPGPAVSPVCSLVLLLSSLLSCRGVSESLPPPPVLFFFSVLQAAVHAGSPSCQREQGAYCLFAFQSNLLLESDIFFFCLPSFGETGFPSSWVTVTSRWTQTHINTSAEKKHSSSLFVCRLGEKSLFSCNLEKNERLWTKSFHSSVDLNHQEIRLIRENWTEVCVFVSLSKLNFWIIKKWDA